MGLNPYHRLAEANSSLWSQLKWYFLWEIFPNLTIYLFTYWLSQGHVGS